MIRLAAKWNFDDDDDDNELTSPAPKQQNETLVYNCDGIVLENVL